MRSFAPPVKAINPSSEIPEQAAEHATPFAVEAMGVIVPTVPEAAVPINFLNVIEPDRTLIAVGVALNVTGVGIKRYAAFVVCTFPIAIVKEPVLGLITT